MAPIYFIIWNNRQGLQVLYLFKIRFRTITKYCINILNLYIDNDRII